MADAVDQKISVCLQGRDEIHLEVILQDDEIVESRLSGVGCLSHLLLLQKWRGQLKGKLQDLPLPEGKEHSEILLREVLLKLKGQWEFPISDKELCHCRMISTQDVDQAIIAGAHTSQKVSDRTSASTACGTCRSDVEELIRYRLGS